MLGGTFSEGGGSGILGASSPVGPAQEEVDDRGRIRGADLEGRPVLAERTVVGPDPAEQVQVERADEVAGEQLDGDPLEPALFTLPGEIGVDAPSNSA